MNLRIAKKIVMCRGPHGCRHNCHQISLADSLVLRAARRKSRLIGAKHVTWAVPEDLQGRLPAVVDNEKRRSDDKLFES